MQALRVILGPCAAETRQQVLETAQALVGMLGRNFIYRAGAWKPRTTPGKFEGVGLPALSWLQEVRDTLGIPVATEVATAEHMKAAIEAHMDYVWVGARTTTNPFLVQELSDVLRESDYKPRVMVKNPVGQDIDLWQGAIERLIQAGAVRPIAIHRGVAPGTEQLRNQPCWAMPIELKRRMPEVEMVIDPSHMAGCRDMIPTLAQQALDMGYEGLMIESHICPSKALSDADQQLTPAATAELLQGLRIRSNALSSSEDNALRKQSSKLTILRGQIDELDDQLFTLLRQRLQVAEEIGEYKREHGMPVVQESRYQQILQKRAEWARAQGVPEKTVRAIMEAIHEASVERQI